MKFLEKLTDAKKLSKKEQQNIKGGYHPLCDWHEDCPNGYYCDGGVCMRIYN